jgi:hypothetical protein
MYFAIEPNVAMNTNRAILYRFEEFSFDTVPETVSAYTSVLLDDVNLEIDDKKRVVSIWGLCPHTRWKPATLVPPESIKGEISLVTEIPLTRGVSLRLTEPGKHLDTFFDKNSGWVMINNTRISSLSVCIFPGVIIDLSKEGEIAKVWLRPILE